MDGPSRRPTDSSRSEGTPSLSEGPSGGAKTFWLLLGRLPKVTRCKSGTLSGRNRSNGYAPTLRTLNTNQTHQPRQRKIPLKLRKAGSVHRLRLTQMPMLQKADQAPHQRLMADQQHIVIGVELFQYLQRTAVRRQPRHSTNLRLKPQRVTYQVCSLLRTHIRTGKDGADRLADQVRGAAQHFTAAMLGEVALGVGARMPFGYTVTQNPQLHSFGSSSRTGCGAGGTLWAASPSGARGVGQSAKGQGFCSVWKLPKRPICARNWLRLSPKFIRPRFGAP